MGVPEDDSRSMNADCGVRAAWQGWRRPGASARLAHLCTERAKALHQLRALSVKPPPSPRGTTCLSPVAAGSLSTTELPLVELESAECPRQVLKPQCFRWSGVLLWRGRNYCLASDVENIDYLGRIQPGPPPSHHTPKHISVM